MPGSIRPLYRKRCEELHAKNGYFDPKPLTEFFDDEVVAQKPDEEKATAERWRARVDKRIEIIGSTVIGATWVGCGWIAYRVASANFGLGSTIGILIGVTISLAVSWALNYSWSRT